MACKVDKIRLPRELDRRVKLSDEDKKKIREEYATGLTSSLKLAKKYGVCKSTILVIVNPRVEKRLKDYVREHWKDLQAPKEERTRAVKENRRYKRELLEKGIIKDSRS